MNIKVQRGHMHVSDWVGKQSPPVSTKDAPLGLNPSSSPLIFENNTKRVTLSAFSLQKPVKKPVR